MKKAIALMMVIISVFSAILSVNVSAATSGGMNEQVIHVETKGNWWSWNPSITLKQNKAMYEYESKTVWGLVTGDDTKTKKTFGSYNITVKNETTNSVETFKWKDKTQKINLEKNCTYTITVKYDAQATLYRNIQFEDEFVNEPNWYVDGKCNVAVCY